MVYEKLVSDRFREYVQIGEKMNRLKYKKKCKKEIVNQITIEETLDRIYKRIKELYEDIDWRKIAEAHKESEKTNE